MLRTLLFSAVTSMSDSLSSWLIRFVLALMPTTQLSVKEFVASANNLHNSSGPLECTPLQQHMMLSRIARWGSLA